MTALWFVVPASGRFTLTQVCLRQLARTCDDLAENGIRASAVVIANDENLDTAAGLGFGTIESAAPLGAKVNDGFEAAAIEGVDFCVPFGSDNFLDPALLTNLRDDEIRCFRRASMVSEDGRRLARLKIRWAGGIGVRVIPTAMLEKCGFRPAEEDIDRGVDSSTLRAISGQIVYHDTDPLQLIDWKSGDNLNSYRGYLLFKSGEESSKPFEELSSFYPHEALEEMAAVYGRSLAVAS